MISKTYDAIVDPCGQSSSLSGTACSYVSLVKDSMRDHILRAAPFTSLFCNLNDASTLDNFISWSFRRKAELDWRTGISLLRYISETKNPSQDLINQLMSYAVSQWTFTDRTFHLCIAAWTHLSPCRVFVATKAVVAFEERDVFYCDLEDHLDFSTETWHSTFPQITALEDYFNHKSC
jgi:hypothetical protein